MWPLKSSSQRHKSSDASFKMFDIFGIPKNPEVPSTALIIPRLPSGDYDTKKEYSESIQKDFWGGGWDG